MHGIHSAGAPPMVGRDDAAADAQLRAALAAFIERQSSLRPRAPTAFTSPALLRELMTGLERARLARHVSPPQPTPSPGVGAKVARWCGASPLERRRAAWRERTRR